MIYCKKRIHVYIHIYIYAVLTYASEPHAWDRRNEPSCSHRRRAHDAPKLRADLFLTRALHHTMFAVSWSCKMMSLIRCQREGVNFAARCRLRSQSELTFGSARRLGALHDRVNFVASSSDVQVRNVHWRIFHGKQFGARTTLCLSKVKKHCPKSMHACHGRA